MATSRPSKFPNVPYAMVRWLVGRVHVGTPNETVAADIERSMRGVKLKGIRHKTVRVLSESSVKEAVRYALECHEENRKTHDAVMRGSRR